jgi:tetratricopeptide (TPR) repeat protein
MFEIRHSVYTGVSQLALQESKVSQKDARLSRCGAEIISHFVHNQFDTALTYIQKFLEISIKKSEIIYCFQSFILNELGRYEEAITSAEKALEYKPNESDAWFYRGFALSGLDRHEDAISSYNKALEFKLDDCDIWFNRGNSLSELGHYEEAADSFGQALILQTDFFEAWNNLGNVLASLERYEEGISSFEKSLKYQPNSILSKVGRAELLLALNHWTEGSEVMMEIIQHLREQNEEYPGDAEWILNGLLTQDTSQWASRIETLLYCFESYSEVLSIALISACKKLLSPLISETTALLWRETWMQAVGTRTEFQIPLRLLNTALHYKQRPNDPRVFLELAEEERKILKQALGLEE